MATSTRMLFFLGVAAVVIGLVWIGQGSGYFPYPRSSFMIDERPWMVRGAVLSMAGLIAIFVARRRRGTR
jgi:hypothetical protein